MSETAPPRPKVVRPVTSEPEKQAPRPVDQQVPFLLDFFPLQEAKQTRLSKFFEALKEGRLTTTRCPSGHVTWPPRVVCPQCHAEDLTWVDLPGTGRIYAFSAVLGGAPLGFERDLPFVVGLVDLEGASMRLFGRIVGTAWTECHVGQPVQVETYELSDGRWFYRFRTVGR
jgi:uncharacterized protein